MINQDQSIELEKLNLQLVAAKEDCVKEAFEVEHLNRENARLRAELEACKAENESLRTSLEPGKASAICHGIFTEATRLGFYKPTAKHALTQFVEEVKRLKSSLTQAQEKQEETAELLFKANGETEYQKSKVAQAQACCAEKDTALKSMRAAPNSVTAREACDKALSSTCGTALLEELRELRGLLAAIDEDTNGGDPFLQELLKLRIEVKELRSFKAKHGL